MKDDYMTETLKSVSSELLQKGMIEILCAENTRLKDLVRSQENEIRRLSVFEIIVNKQEQEDEKMLNDLAKEFCND